MNIIEKLYLMQDKNLVYYDVLTGVKSRIYYDRVMKKKYLGKRVYVYFVDIDNLKVVNDTKGHSEGSELIRSVANTLRLMDHVKDVSRIGGDEFCVVAMEELVFPEPVEESNQTDKFSYGCYIKEEWEDMSSALRKADEAMYEMKRKRKEEVVKG